MDSHDNEMPKETREEAYFFASIKDFISEAIYALDLEGKIIHTNIRTLDITGYSSEELIGRHYSKLFDSNELPGIERLFVRVSVQGESVLKYETRILRKDGTMRIVSLNTMPFKEDGRISAIVGLGEDITERKLSEERLNYIQAEYKDLIEKANGPIIKVDTQLTIIFLTNLQNSYSVSRRPKSSAGTPWGQLYLKSRALPEETLQIWRRTS